MLRTFRGETSTKVDNKGRVTIPAKFRDVLEVGDPDWPRGPATGGSDNPGGPGLVIVYGDARRAYLECFPLDAIAAVDAKIARLPRGSARRRALQRLYNGQSFPTGVDETGRIVLPAKLRSKIGLDGTAFFIGNGDTFEIWDPDTYERTMGAVLDADDAFDPDVDPSVYLDGDEA